MTSDEEVNIAALAGSGDKHEAVCRALYEVLLRTARWELRGLQSGSDIGRADLDDIACQAAADALLSVIRKVGEFRGESRLSTWAKKFAVLEVRSKLRQHRRHHRSVPVPPDECERLAPQVKGPAVVVEARDLARAIDRVVQSELTDRQRDVFHGLHWRELSPGALAAELGMKANAVHQASFRARRGLRMRLEAEGFLS